MKVLGSFELSLARIQLNEHKASISAVAMDDEEAVNEWNPHAFHRHLPPHHIDTDGVPYISKFAQDKARKIVALAESLELHESLFVRDDDNGMRVDR